ncbi:hypothetical protein ACFC09_23710 [Streptomyces sp. NPDC056161]|uniref:hypothetical protein n=1 Tax=Streptomyces sp. NPDC056161 TaxID=3345732 RepID=UPI0035E10489
MRPTARAVPPSPVLIAQGARAERSYAARNPLVAGDRRSRCDGTGGPAAAVGQSSVVSGPRAVLFGTEPPFRDHRKGEFAPQLPRALFAVAAVRGSSVEENG